jgi:hypothetical protein
MHPLIQFLILIIVAGALLYILEFAPIDATLKRIAWVVVIIIVLVMAIYMLIPMLGGFGSSYPMRR